MRRTGRALFTLALTALLATEAARASSEAPVRIGFLEFPPFSYLDPQQQPQGNMLAFARRLAEQARLNVELTPYPPAIRRSASTC